MHCITRHTFGEVSINIIDKNDVAFFLKKNVKTFRLDYHALLHHDDTLIGSNIIELTFAKAIIMMS